MENENKKEGSEAGICSMCQGHGPVLGAMCWGCQRRRWLFLIIPVLILIVLAGTFAVGFGLGIKVGGESGRFSKNHSSRNQRMMRGGYSGPSGYYNMMNNGNNTSNYGSGTGGTQPGNQGNVSQPVAPN